MTKIKSISLSSYIQSVYSLQKFNNKYIAVGGHKPYEVIIINKDEYKIEYKLHGHTSVIICFCHLYQLNNNHLLSGSSDGTIILWDLENKQNVFQYSDGDFCVISLAYLNNRLFVSSSDVNIRLWNIDNSKCLKTIDFKVIGNIVNVDKEICFWADDKLVLYDIIKEEILQSLEDCNSDEHSYPKLITYRDKNDMYLVCLHKYIYSKYKII